MKPHHQINTVTIYGKVHHMKELEAGRTYVNLMFPSPRGPRFVPCFLNKTLAEYAAAELCIGDTVIVAGRIDNWVKKNTALKTPVISVDSVTIVGKAEDPGDMIIDADK